MTTFVKYEIFKCDACEFPYQYGAKFREIGNELTIYFEASKMNANWLIYKYLSGLSTTAKNFIDRWIAEHDSFNNIMKNGPKNDVTVVMHVYESQCVNPIEFSTTNGTGVALLATGLAVEIIKNTAEGSMVVQMVFKCDYKQCDKSGY